MKGYEWVDNKLGLVRCECGVVCHIDHFKSSCESGHMEYINQVKRRLGMNETKR